MTIEGDNDYLQKIWTRFKSGDQEAFAVLYNLHVDHLFHYGTKLCKDEDAVKDAIAQSQKIAAEKMQPMMGALGDLGL